MIGALALAAVLTVRGDRLFIPANINGIVTEAVLDSAAESTFLDDGFAARVGAKDGTAVTARGSGGSAQAQLVEHVKVEAVGVTLPDTTVGVIDLDDVGKRLFGHPLDAIVGRDFFDAARLAIDIEAGTIDVLSREAKPAGTQLPLAPHHGIETVPISIEGSGPVQAEFDLGNGSDMMISKAYAERSGLIKRVEGTVSGGGIGGAVQRPVVILKSVRIAGVDIPNVRAGIAEQENAADANIGVKLLRRFKIVTDFARKSVWLQGR